MPESISLHERQRHYDRVHHQQRVLAIDSGTMPDHFSASDKLQMRIASVEYLRLINEHGMTANAVDLNDATYLAELDASQP